MNSATRTQRTIIGLGTGAAIIGASVAPITAVSAEAGGMPSAGVTVGGVNTPAYGETVSTSPSSAAPGEGFNISGSGFTPGDTVSIEFGGETIGTAKVDANGNFSTTATVPTHMPVGEHPLDVNGTTGTSKDTNYTVTAPPPPTPTPVATPRAPYYVPRVSSTPGSAPAGGTVTFSGEGFRPGELVTISFGGSDIATVQADGQGKFTTSGRIPDDMPVGDHPLDANGDLGSSWDGELGVSPSTQQAPAPTEPKFGMAPGSGMPGEYVVFTGKDFHPGEYVTIGFGGSVIAMATASATGAFATSGMIPLDIPAGGHPLDVNGDMGSSWDGELTVVAASTPAPSSTPSPASTPAPTAQAPAPQAPSAAPSTGNAPSGGGSTAPAAQAQARVQVTPGSAAAGEFVAFEGTGFQAGERVSVEFGGRTLASATADANGGFRASGYIPAHMPAGAHPMEVNGDRGSSVSGAFTVKAAQVASTSAQTTPSTTSASSAPATSSQTTATTSTASRPAASTRTTTTVAGSTDTRDESAATENVSTTSSDAMVLAGAEPKAPAQQPVAVASESSSEAGTASNGSDERSEAASQGSSSTLMLALVAMAGAMPVLAGAGWVLGTRRNRRAAPQRRTW